MYLKLGVIIGILLFIPACSQNNGDYRDEPTFEGYIVEVREAGRKDILVVEGISKEEAVSKSWKELVKKYGQKIDAHIFYTDSFFSADYKSGQKVRVWAEGGVMESFPPQAEAGKIEIIEK